tara:strand:- start:1081 stop:1725 length:645 start_codon:yes stop_codon:yes gene_type:complete
MKYIKYLLLSSTIYSLGLFTNCGEENKDPLVDTPTINDNTDDDSNTILDADGESVTDSDLIYIDDNGITIKADTGVVIGKSYKMDGNSYLIVDSTMLYKMIKDSADVTQVITSLITNMSYMFPSSNFNQNISHWDVSNVTDMRVMFYYNTSFNQDISNWDVSEVTDMGDMLANTSSFNQDLSTWDVSKVTFCNDFSVNTIAWTAPKPNFTNCKE